MKLCSFLACAVLLAISTSVPARQPSTVVVPQADVKWADAGVKGVSVAAVDGDMKKGGSHFYLRYAAGLVTPLHHHSADHQVVTISGNLVLVVDGKEHRLTPGSYFAFRGKAPHSARCEGSQDCVMFIDARGPWDVVVANKKP